METTSLKSCNASVRHLTPTTPKTQIYSTKHTAQMHQPVEQADSADLSRRTPTGWTSFLERLAYEDPPVRVLPRANW